MSRSNCPVCGSENLEVFLRREGVPVHQHLLHRDPGDAIGIGRGLLEMTACAGCGFVFNRAFDPSLLDYGATYDNTQSCSQAFVDYVDALVDDIASRHGVTGRRLVEVGCGKGAFLRALVERGGNGTTGVGFDPSYLGPDEDLGGSLRFERTFYGPDSATVPADIVVSRHVIEHVPEPLQMLRTIRLALGNAPGAKVFFETPDVAWILRHQVVWDFFYEHCSLFTPEALATAFRRSGFRVTGARPLFASQYQWIEAEVGDDDAPTDAAGVPELARSFSRAFDDRRRRWARMMRRLAGEGAVALWGAGAKGVTFAGITDPDRRLLDCVVDVNPRKQGCFLPGTGHAIVSPDALVGRGVRHAVLLNPNYHAEIAATLATEAPRVTLVNVMKEAE